MRKKIKLAVIVVLAFLFAIFPLKLLKLALFGDSTDSLLAALALFVFVLMAALVLWGIGFFKEHIK